MLDPLRPFEPLWSRPVWADRDTVCNPAADRVTEVSLVPGRVTETNLEPAPGRERDTDLSPELRDTDCSFVCIESPECPPDPARVTEGSLEDCILELFTKERFTVC